jgi:hypothetical protein
MIKKSKSEDEYFAAKKKTDEQDIREDIKEKMEDDK